MIWWTPSATLMAMTSPEPLPQQPGQPGPPPGYGPPPYQQMPYGPPVKKKGMPTWAIVLLVIGAIVVVLCIGGVALLGLGAKSISDSNSAAAKDITIAGCTDDGGLTGPTATVDITNHGSRTASYVVSIEFVSPDGSTQYGTGTAIVNNLAAGQNATTNATSFASGKTTGGFTCKVTKVSKI